MVNLEDENFGIDEPTVPIHPLLIDHVVETILKHVDYNNGNILECRRVCKLWNEISTSLYKGKHQQVEVGSYSTSVPKFRRLIKLQKGNPSFQNPKYQDSSWPSPFVKFRLCQEVFQPIYSSVISDFFQTFQFSLEALDIWLDLRSTMTDVSINLKSKLRCFPNLKKIVYDDRRVVLLEGSKVSRGSLLQNLVELSPSLQMLSIRFQRDFRGSVECASDMILNHIRSIFYNRQLQNSLKFLKLDVHINDQLLNCLQITNLRIETLEIAMRGSHFTFQVFKTFCESVHATLKILKVTYIERDSSCFLAFPRMSALKELEMDGTDAFSKHSVAFGDFTYAENFPQLQSLRFNIWASNNLKWNQFFRGKRQIWTMTELKLPGELCDKMMMSCVANLFPNIKKLQVSLYSLTLDALEIIFERMTQLEELTVTKFPSLWDRNEKNIDFVLTGISAYDCDKIVKENLGLKTMADDELLVLKTRPGITDLRRLKKLMMPDIQYQASYSDITGYLAFLKMPGLKYLNVGRSNLSNQCLIHLANKFPEMEEQRRLPPTFYKEPEEDDDGSFLDLPGDTCVYL